MSHPPCGGCGLKLRLYIYVNSSLNVTLRVEGVD